ncbi:O-antigen ligase family protein [Maribellus mangrovi]|uniref:O-antigen ligase family protein n=1 Tax=Maribellus mangrovi TaxID=3133146 RepID=UPI0030EF0241
MTVLGIDIGVLYFVILWSCFFALLVLSKNFELNLLSLWLVFAALYSIIFNIIPEFFSPYERLFAFILTMGLLGPLVHSDILDQFKLKLFHILSNAFIILVTVSFLAKVTGIYSGLDAHHNYSGFFNGSMVLSPIAVIAMIYSITLALYHNKNKIRWLYYFAALLCFLSAIVAGSRIALLGGTGGILYFIYKFNQSKPFKYLFSIALISGILILSFPLWKQHTVFLQKKIEYSSQQGSLTASRDKLWQARINEFLTSPIIGIGFSSVDTDNNKGSKFSISSGRIEPGSSWLAILSMTGLFGFLPFFLIQIRNLISLFKHENIYSSALLGAYNIFYIIHLTSEGYAFSAGSSLFIHFWLSLGITDIYLKQSNSEYQQIFQ